jgi:hypothetical protein
MEINLKKKDLNIIMNLPNDLEHSEITSFRNYILVIGGFSGVPLK